MPELIALIAFGVVFSALGLFVAHKAVEQGVAHNKSHPDCEKCNHAQRSKILI